MGKVGVSPYSSMKAKASQFSAIVQASAESSEMELLLILMYASICIVIFKIFRIPMNQWSLSTAVLGGIVGIALLLIGMAYNHPFSTNARI
jgi:phosphate/sulfate permease